MIPFDFAYYRPDTAREAYNCWQQLKRAGKDPVWYGGGTELISMARVGSRAFGAVVDLKGVPACTRLERGRGRVTLGAAVTLTQIEDSGLFPLLGRTAARIADHTIQGKITLGGNLAGTIKYREAALPLLLCHCTAHVMTAGGEEERPFDQVFDGRLTLDDGEFLLNLSVPEEEAARPGRHAKRTRLDKIDYPLATLCAVRDGDTIRAAVSGYAAAPARLSPKLELPAAEESLSGSRGYKEFVLKAMLAEARAELEAV